MRDQAEPRVGHLYPRVQLPESQGGRKATVIAWLWARTVSCPNPACGVDMPLLNSFSLSRGKDKEAWLDPVTIPTGKTVRFRVRHGKGRPQKGDCHPKRCYVLSLPISGAP